MRKQLTIILVLLSVCLLVDFSIAAYTEFRISRQIRESLHLDADPAVLTGGFPFLWQIHSQTFQSVNIRAEDVPDNTISRFTAEGYFEHAQTSFTQLTKDIDHKFTVSKLVGRLIIHADELSNFFGVRNVEIFVEPDKENDNDDHLIDTVVIAGENPFDTKGRVNIRANLELGDHHIKIVPTGLYIDPGRNDPPVVPDSQLPELFALFSKTIPFTTLPFGVIPHKVKAHSNTILIEGESHQSSIALQDFLPTQE